MSNSTPPIRITAEHGIVYRHEREFCAWPFICGFWTTAEGHHLVAFQKKPANYTDPGDVHHDEVAKVGPKIVTLRSRDNGASWDGGTMGVLFDLGADQIHRQIALDGHRHLRQQILVALADIEECGFADRLGLGRIGQFQFSGFFFKPPVELL